MRPAPLQLLQLAALGTEAIAVALARQGGLLARLPAEKHPWELHPEHPAAEQK